MPPCVKLRGTRRFPDFSVGSNLLPHHPVSDPNHPNRTTNLQRSAKAWKFSFFIFFSLSQYPTRRPLRKVCILAALLGLLWAELAEMMVKMMEAPPAGTGQEVSGQPTNHTGGDNHQQSVPGGVDLTLLTHAGGAFCFYMLGVWTRARAHAHSLRC